MKPRISWPRAPNSQARDLNSARFDRSSTRALLQSTVPVSPFWASGPERSTLASNKRIHVLYVGDPSVQLRWAADNPDADRVNEETCNPSAHMLAEHRVGSDFRDSGVSKLQRYRQFTCSKFYAAALEDHSLGFRVEVEG